MAHKTLVGGTAYDVTGGITLVDGVSYSIKNGKVLVDGTAYDISFLLPPAVLDLWSGTDSDNSINCITYANGYWVVGGIYFDDNTSTQYARIAYATKLNGIWTTKDLWGNGNTTNAINCITYANGYWVVGGIYSINSYDHYARIAYATSPSGTWSTKNIWTNDADYTSYRIGITCITYANGYWVVGGMYYTSEELVADRTYYARIAYATSLSGSWNTKNIWTQYGSVSPRISITCITYANGYWVVGGHTYTSSGSLYNSCIAYATSPSGTWNTKNIWSHTRTNDITCITYADGYWVVGGYYINSSSTRYGRIAYATALDGTWINKNVWTDSSSATINCITYANGYWVVGGDCAPDVYKSACIAYATALDGTWTTKIIWSCNSHKNNMHCIIYADDSWVVGGYGSDDSDSTYYARIAYALNLEELGEI